MVADTKKEALTERINIPCTPALKKDIRAITSQTEFNEAQLCRMFIREGIENMKSRGFKMDISS